MQCKVCSSRPEPVLTGANSGKRRVRYFECVRWQFLRCERRKQPLLVQDVRAAAKWNA